MSRSVADAIERAANEGRITEGPALSIPSSRKGRGVPHEPGKMNGLEKRYARHLDALKTAREVVEWYFEPLKFKLAPATFYTPDFMVLMADLTIEFHETKGFMQEHNAVKLKVAAAMFPFPFRLVKWKAKLGWKITEVTGRV